MKFELPDSVADALWTALNAARAIPSTPQAPAPSSLPAPNPSTPAAPVPAAPGARVPGPPTTPSPGPGYQWMGAQSIGGWVEGWVFVGAPVGSTDLSAETPMQYAQRMGVPIGAWITSKADVDKYLADKTASPGVPVTSLPPPSAPPPATAEGPPFLALDPLRDLALFVRALNQMGVNVSAAHNALMAQLGNATQQTAIGAQIEQGAAGGNAQGNFSDPQVYQIVNQLHYGKTVQQTFDAFPPGAVTMAKVQHYHDMVVQYGIAIVAQAGL